MKKISLCLILMAVLVSTVLLASCGEKQPKVETTALDGWQEFTILRPDIADAQTVEAAVALRTAVEEKLGFKMTLTTDWVKRGEEVPTGTKEILIGSTNRPESIGHELKHLDFTVGFTNNRVVITGGCGDAVAAGVEWYISNCIGEAMMVPAENYVYHAEYPYENVTVGGIKLSDYAVTTDFMNENANVYNSMREWIADNTGVYPADKGENQIIFGVDPALNMEDISFKTDGGDLTIMVSDMGYSIAQAYEKLLAKLETRDGDDLVLNEVLSLPMGNFATATDAMIAEWEAQADALREKILKTPNMEIPDKKVVYYISPKGDDANSGTSPAQAWKTISRLNNAQVASGSFVCFERGGIYRGKISARPGVTYTAYGKGDKPEIWGSPFNGAEVGKWEEVEKNIWRYSEKITTDVGVIVMDEGEAYGHKIILDYGADPVVEYITKEEWKGYINLNENYEYWHDLGGAVVENAKGGYIYMYCDEGNPAELWDQIEFNTRGNVIAVGANSDVTVDNLCIMYGGSHGIGAGTVNNLKVTNCEVGWIGGSMQHYTNGRPTRFGNGIEIYGGCTNFVIDNCWVYQCYDAGITHQYSAVGSNDIIMDGVYYTNNLIEDCIYNIEYFLGKPESGAPTRYMTNIYMADNILVDAGYGFGEQRPNKTPDAHIKGWDHMNTLEGDFIIENNLFLRSKYMMVHIGVQDEAYLPVMRGNIFAQLEGGQWGRFAKNPTKLLMYNYGTVSAEEYGLNDFYIINVPDEEAAEDVAK